MKFTKEFELAGRTFAMVSRSKIGADSQVVVALGDFLGQDSDDIPGSQTLDANDCRDLSDWFARLAVKLDKKTDKVNYD